MRNKSTEILHFCLHKKVFQNNLKTWSLILYLSNHAFSLPSLLRLTARFPNVRGPATRKQLASLPTVQTSVFWHDNKWNGAHFHQALHMQVWQLLQRFSRYTPVAQSLICLYIPGLISSRNASSHFCVYWADSAYWTGFKQINQKRSISS